MDLTSLIQIAIVVVVVYFLLKFVVSPIIKIIVGIISVIILIYILQRFFGFDIDKVLAPFGVSLNSGKWGFSFDWILGPLNYYIDKIKEFVVFIFGNLPKSTIKD